MLFRSIVPLPRGTLSPHQVVQLTNVYLENAHKSNDHDVALVLCHNAEAVLSQAKGTTRKSFASASPDTEDQTMHEIIATAYFNLGKLLENQGHGDEAKAFYKKSEKWG